jgi:Zn ribbon nucleic-acid-binding protein
MNDIKTKAMIVEGAKAPKMQSKAAFDCLHKQEGKTHRERKLEKVQCHRCGFMLQRLEQHQSRKDVGEKPGDPSQSTEPGDSCRSRTRDGGATTIAGVFVHIGTGYDVRVSVHTVVCVR